VKVGDLVQFNEQAMGMWSAGTNKIMLVLEMSGWKHGTAPTLLSLDFSGLVRRQYQHHLEVINESR